MTPSSPLMILVAPQLEENIGAAARAMGNFGLSRLCLVNPRCLLPSSKAQGVACAAGREVLKNATIKATLEEACGDASYVLGLTARRRAFSVPTISLEEACSRGRKTKQCAFLFGGERNGLDNDAISLCDHIVTLPSYEASPSLNLAQSVMLTSYIWGREEPKSSLFSQRESVKKVDIQKEEEFPTMDEWLFFFRRLEFLLEQGHFFSTEERKALMMRKLRTLFKRASLRKSELALMRGVIETLAEKVSPSITLTKKPF